MAQPVAIKLLQQRDRITAETAFQKEVEMLKFLSRNRHIGKPLPLPPPTSSIHYHSDTDEAPGDVTKLSPTGAASAKGGAETLVVDV